MKRITLHCANATHFSVRRTAAEAKSRQGHPRFCAITLLTFHSSIQCVFVSAYGVNPMQGMRPIRQHGSCRLSPLRRAATATCAAAVACAAARTKDIFGQGCGCNHDTGGCRRNDLCVTEHYVSQHDIHTARSFGGNPASLCWHRHFLHRGISFLRWNFSIGDHRLRDCRHHCLWNYLWDVQGKKPTDKTICPSLSV
jgi:hypothetical protein